MCLFPSKYKFILHYNRAPNSCHSSSLCGTGEMATCDMRKEEKRRGELFPSGAAGRKIANILRHRRHRERDGASKLVCMYTREQVVFSSSSSSLTHFHLFPLRPLGRESSEIYQRQKTTMPVASSFWHFNLIQAHEIRKEEHQRLFFRSNVAAYK